MKPGADSWQWYKLALPLLALVIGLLVGLGYLNSGPTEAADNTADIFMNTVGLGDCSTDGDQVGSCLVAVNADFTITVRLASFPGAPNGYSAYQARLNYSGGLTENGESQLWPGCVFPSVLRDAASIFVGCAGGVGAPPSTHLGALVSVVFSCGPGATSHQETIEMPHGMPIDTLIVDDTLNMVPDKDPDEVITIFCGAPPQATHTPTVTPTATHTPTPTPTPTPVNKPTESPVTSNLPDVTITNTD